MQAIAQKICRIVVCFSILGSIPAAQAQTNAIPDRIVQAEVLPGWRNSDGTHIAGLRLTLAPGWKTYWRVPGEAGIPPTFSWRGSRNLSDVQIVWPTPKVFDQAGTQSIGYVDQVILPLRVASKKSDGDIRLKGTLQIGVCRDICVPETLRVQATLPTDGPRMPQIVAALVDQPLSKDEAGVRSAQCTVRPIRDGMAIRAVIDMPSAGAPEAVVIEPADPKLYVTQAHTTRQGKTLTAEVRAYHEDGAVFLLSRDTTRLTVIGSNHAVDIVGCSG